MLETARPSCPEDSKDHFSECPLLTRVVVFFFLAVAMIPVMNPQQQHHPLLQGHAAAALAAVGGNGGGGVLPQTQEQSFHMPQQQHHPQQHQTQLGPPQTYPFTANMNTQPQRSQVGRDLVLFCLLESQMDELFILSCSERLGTKLSRSSTPRP